MKEIKTTITNISVDDIHPYDGSHNTDDVIEALKQSIKQFGIYQPITVDRNHIIAKGNAVYRAAKELGYKDIPCIVKDDLTDEEINQYRIADNQTSKFASWNEGKLKSELSYLPEPSKLQFAFDEDLQSILGSNSFGKKITKQDPAKTECTKDKNFSDSIKSAEESMEVKKVEYFEYVCSKCGKKVNVRL